MKTNKAVLLGHYAENMPAGDSTVVVESLGDYLRGTGFVSSPCSAGALYVLCFYSIGVHQLTHAVLLFAPSIRSCPALPYS